MTGGWSILKAMAISPTVEGFRAAFRRPSLALAEIAWRWTVGATAAALFLFGLIQYLDTLPVTNGELLLLRTRHPYLVGEAIAHILRGSQNRVVMAALLVSLMMVVLWIAAASVGRMATVRGLIEYFRGDMTCYIPAVGNTARTTNDGERDVASNVSTARIGNTLAALLRLNFLRAAVGLAAAFGLVGAGILAGLVSPEANPQPVLAFILFLPLAALICFVWWTLNWVLSLAGMFAVREGGDAVGAIGAAVAFCRERTGRVFAVTIWIGLAHLVAFVAATTVVSTPLGFVAVVPWRLVVAAMILATVIYFAIADWLYVTRLAGYVCIAETPEALLSPSPAAPPVAGPPVPARPVQNEIDRDELILSDVPSDIPNLSASGA
jgi:hypothetical protein